MVLERVRKMVRMFVELITYQANNVNDDIVLGSVETDYYATIVTVEDALSSTGSRPRSALGIDFTRAGKLNLHRPSVSKAETANRPFAAQGFSPCPRSSTSLERAWSSLNKNSQSHLRGVILSRSVASKMDANIYRV